MVDAVEAMNGYKPCPIAHNPARFGTARHHDARYGWLYRLGKLIREQSQIPVIMLTAKSEKRISCKGRTRRGRLSPALARANDSRIRAVLRRSAARGDEETGKIVVDDRLTIDFDRHEVWVEGELIQLRPTEYRLLYHLVKNAGWVLTHDQILNKVWGYEYENEPHYVRLYINYLRKKSKKIPAIPFNPHRTRYGISFVDYKREGFPRKVNGEKMKITVITGTEVKVAPGTLSPFYLNFVMITKLEFIFHGQSPICRGCKFAFVNEVNVRMRIK